MAQIKSDDNHIFIDGIIRVDDTRPLGSQLYQIIRRKGYDHVVLDFSETEAAYAQGMLPFIALCENYSCQNVRFEVRLPKRPQLRHLFLNTNWAHLLSPDQSAQSAYNVDKHASAMRFDNPETQDQAVESIMKTMSSKLQQVAGDAFTALQWSLNEITDNVLWHSKSKSGGFIQATTFSSRRSVSVVVADAGIGVPASFRDSRISLRNDSHALEQAIKEGVTSKPKLNQGNGLFGSYQIAVMSGGQFRIESGKGILRADKSNLRTSMEYIPLRGTTVLLEIDCSSPDLLARALRFKGEAHTPAMDWLELQFPLDENGNLTFLVKECVPSLGSREAGRAVKNQIRNIILSLPSSGHIIVDFAGVPVISSSFADEVFGMIFAELGPLRFMHKFKFSNVHPIVQGLIDLAIEKRIAAGTH